MKVRITLLITKCIFMKYNTLNVKIIMWTVYIKSTKNYEFYYDIAWNKIFFHIYHTIFFEIKLRLHVNEIHEFIDVNSIIEAHGLKYVMSPSKIESYWFESLFDKMDCWQGFQLIDQILT